MEPLHEVWTRGMRYLALAVIAVLLVSALVPKRWLYRHGRPTAWPDCSTGVGPGPRSRAVAEPLGDAAGPRTPHGTHDLLSAGRRRLPGRALPGGDAWRGLQLGAQRPGRRWSGGAAPWASRDRAPGGGRPCRAAADPAPILVGGAGARPHIPVDRHAPVEDFERIAAQFPVFRVTTDQPAPEPAVDSGCVRPSLPDQPWIVSPGRCSSAPSRALERANSVVGPCVRCRPAHAGPGAPVLVSAPPSGRGRVLIEPHYGACGLARG